MSSNVKVDKISPTTNCGTVTLGDSGDTISIPSGATLSVGGSVSGLEGVVSWDTTPKTSAFTAVATNGYFVDTSSAAITVTLPASPSAGDLVGIKDYKLTADTNNITIARNGSNIQGTANDFLIDTEGRSVTLIYVDATQGWLITGASQASDIQETPLYITATGGTVTTCSDYKIHTFTGPGTFTVCSVGNPYGSDTVDYMVIAGGAGGSKDGTNSNGGGGGGAGGYRESSGAASGCYSASPLGACVSALPVSAQGYPIAVGSGGSGGQPVAGSNGGDSTFSTITSSGGGRGGWFNAAPGANGGSGGGGGAGGGSGGTGNTPPVSPPQGNNGSSSNPSGPGAGGGAASAGSGGNGGNGTPSTINGTATTRGGGGARGTPGGSAGPGGGGARQSNGTANTGGGGGGNNDSNAAGSGGSGIVIIRYKFQ